MTDKYARKKIPENINYLGMGKIPVMYKKIFVDIFTDEKIIETKPETKKSRDHNPQEYSAIIKKQNKIQIRKFRKSLDKNLN
jgi:hypothetical protein